MDESDFHALRHQVESGRLTRRAATQRLLAAGLTLPMSYALLAGAGVPASARAQGGASPAYAPTRRGGGGALRCLFWQAPTSLNPHFATGTKDADAARVFYEPLARWDREGELQPVLASEIPSRANGGVAADGRSVTWKLKRGVTWHDGQPFTADDLLFNADYARDPATAATTSGLFDDMQFQKVDAHTVRVLFDKPTPFWASGHCTISLIPRHIFQPHRGAASRDAAANNRPVGTGPYRFVEFRPGDLLRAALNPTYHGANRPHFDTFEIKGGGDATSAARAVLQTGEYDYAWNLLVEDEVLKRVEAGGRGRADMAAGGTMEFLLLNPTDPNVEVEGERSHPSTKHPFFSDKAVRDAVNLLIDRQGIQQFIYGRTAVATPNIVHNPARFRSPNIQREFNVDKAIAALEAAGWKRGADGIRAKDGRKLKLVFQTTVNASRQKTQQAIKAAFIRAGIDVELKAVSSAVFFSADVANPDTNGQFRADMQMYASGMGQPDPGRFMDRYVSWEVAGKANKYQGRNVLRWRNEAYDRLYRAAEVELDPARRAALFVRMNDLVVGDGYLVPLLFRMNVNGLANKLVAPLSGWDLDMSTLAEWYRTA
ncbi:MAG: peptide ABC transporter substrate-binding protein [Rubrivivax sp.]